MTHTAEHRLIRYNASTFRPLSTGGDPASVQNARERDRALIRKAEDSVNVRPAAPRPTATSQAPTGGYASVADVEAAQGDYYIKNGATSPELEAYGYNLANPQAPKPTPPAARNPGPPAGSQAKRATGTTAVKKKELATMQQRVAARKQDRLNKVQAQGRDLPAVVAANGEMTLADFRKNNLDPMAQQYEEVEGVKYLVLPDGTKVRVKSDVVDQAKAEMEEDQREQGEIATAASALKEQEDAARQEDRATGDQPTAEPEEAPDPTRQTGDALMDGLFAYAAQNPEFAASFLPQLAQLQAIRGSTDNARRQSLAELDSTDLNQDGVTDGVAASVQASKDALKVEKDEADRITKENKDIALEAAQIAKEMAQIEKDRFELNQVKRENDLREQNIEAEIRNRRASGKLGIGGDTNGLQWMQKEIRRGNEALTALQSDGDLIRQGYALAIGRQYNVDVRAAINSYDAMQAQNSKVHSAELRELDKMVTLDAADRRKEKQAIEDKHADRVFQTELKAVDMLDKATQNMLAMKKEARDAKATERKEARDALQWLVQTYGSNADPRAVAKYTAQLGEEGSWFAQMTLAEMKAAEGASVTPVQTFEAQNSLRKEFTSSEVYKSHERKAESWDKIQGAVAESNRLQALYDEGKAPKESMLGSDLNMMYSFIKLLDDTSAVREGELELLSSGQSWKSYVQEFIKKGDEDGTTLTTEQRNSILKQAQSINQYTDIRFKQHQQDTAAMIEDANTRLGLDINPRSVLGADWYPGGADAADAAIDEATGGEASQEQYQTRADRPTTAPTLAEWRKNFKTKTQGYHDRIDYKVHGEHKHNGLDLDGAMNDPIPAFRGGIVTFAGKDGGYGNKVVVQDPETGYQFVYAHLNKINVKKDQKIGHNTPVGLMGNTGFSRKGKGGDGSHLHFELLDPNGRPIDPEGFDFGGRTVASNSTRI